MDRYFTSYYIVQHFLDHGLTAFGTVFAHRRDVPACLRKAARRDFLPDITLISYVPRKKSNVLLMTSCDAK
ncbi:hypothetical protein T07_11861 [Trichinella nelsoni]|uniref:PiggyBac transposable element-derived protein domain-containing protein n=1 Tax=Trichinella nelsoni TaxID=6336 RepID=A0A0V0RZV0_9BILA|nr:hypothetical protein T07_11861 [Trichinella nelsoni]